MTRMRALWLVLLVAIAWQRDADARKFLDAIGDADRAILDDMYNGNIVEARPFSENQNMGSLWKVRVEHNGQSRWAVFKPRPYGDRDGWARTPMEVAVYKLNRILGMDMVAPAAYRRNVWLNGTFFAEGALISWVDDAHKVVGRVGDGEWKPLREAFSSDLRILQSVSRDADNQNANNIIRGKHWKDGKYRVMKVDNEASMRFGAYVELDHNVPPWGPISRFNRQTYDRLKELSFQDLKGDVGEFLSDDEIRQWLGQRDRLVGHIDQQLRQRGDAVFFAANEIAFDSRIKAGKPASASQLRKFANVLKRKGVKLEYYAKGARTLQGAVGRAVLGADGTVTVRLAGKPGHILGATLVEELIHVNQMQRMAKQNGGLQGLYAALANTKRSTAKLVRLSMEEDAKARMTVVTKGPSRDKIEAAKQRLHNQAMRCSGGSCDTRSLWRTTPLAKR
jgi:hypothetical protein